MKIIAGIVLFNPDLERLVANISEIIKQVDEVIIVDNFSDNLAQVKMELYKFSNIRLIENNENLGIAKALNQICETALLKKYEWVYLLDQDSISSPTIIQSYKKYGHLVNWF